jgi:hypothetical protein
MRRTSMYSAAHIAPTKGFSSFTIKGKLCPFPVDYFVHADVTHEIFVHPE